MPRTRANDGPPAGAAELLYYFCRLQLPAVVLAPEAIPHHLRRTFDLHRSKWLNKPEAYGGKRGPAWPGYLDNLYAVDWFIAVACLEGDERAWDYLFAARASRTDCLLVDALRSRAVRLYPRDEEKQEGAVAEFWGHLLVSETPESPPVLARYDGQRPLVPWLIRVFQNRHISQLRHRHGQLPLPEDDLAAAPAEERNGEWHEAFCLAARECIGELQEQELLILGLRLRYRMNQRAVANLVGLHEGTISRQTGQLRDRCLDHIGRRLAEQGWSGDELSGMVLTEMDSLLMDEPRLAADSLARLLAQRGKSLPPDLDASP